MIIDFHTHIFPEKIAERAVGALAKNSGSVPYSNGTEGGLLGSMETGGISLSVNLPAITKPEQFESTFRFACEINAKMQSDAYKNRKILSFAGIHPLDENYEEHLYSVREAGILGIKIHPDYQGTFIDDERYIRILSLAKKLDLITVTHAGVDGAFIGQPVKCPPERVLRVLDRLGGYSKLVLAHLGGAAMPEEVLAKIAGEDVYIDTAYVLAMTPKETLLKLVERHGEERILFATDSPWSGQKEDVERIKALGLPSSAEERIFSSNAIKLLGL